MASTIFCYTITKLTQMDIETKALTLDELLSARQSIANRLDNGDIGPHEYVSSMIYYDKQIEKITDKYNTGR